MSARAVGARRAFHPHSSGLCLPLLAHRDQTQSVIDRKSWLNQSPLLAQAAPTKSPSHGRQGTHIAARLSAIPPHAAPMPDSTHLLRITRHRPTRKIPIAAPATVISNPEITGSVTAPRFRNTGRFPKRHGAIVAKILTLSAITPAFNPIMQSRFVALTGSWLALATLLAASVVVSTASFL